MRIFILLLLVLYFSKLAAQCPQVLSCTPGVTTVCDQTDNQSQLWNQVQFFNNEFETHDLPEGPVDMELQVLNPCGGNVHLAYRLQLDTDGNGMPDTEIDSDHLPGLDTVYFNNLLTSGGNPTTFDGRAVAPGFKYRFAVQETVSGDTLTGRVRWHAPSSPVQFAIPELPYRKHRIIWYVKNNGVVVDSCVRQYDIRDCKNPNVVCINGLNVNIMSTQMITLWAMDFLQYADDNVTPPELLKISIEKANESAGVFPVDFMGNPRLSVAFNCLELGPQLVRLWARDVAGNAAYCQTSVLIQDPNFNCSSDPVGNFPICFSDCSGPWDGDTPIQIKLDPSGPSWPQIPIYVVPDMSGCATLPNMPMPIDFTITPFLDINYMNGVSTYDIVLINKHILGLQPLNSPYKLIAADVNKSNSVTTFDAVELRKLILGIYDKFPQNTSYRFINQDFVFPDPLNPFQTPFWETALSGDPSHDFFVVKVGDVNCSAINSREGAMEERGTFPVVLPQQHLEAGETAEWALTPGIKTTLDGFQMGLEYDAEKLEILGVYVAGQMDAEREYWLEPVPGVLNVSWASADAKPADLDGGLVRLKVRAKQPVEAGDALRFGSKGLRAEAYTAGGRLLNMSLNVSRSSAAGFIGEAWPNPTAAGAVIAASLNADTRARLAIFDALGRVVYHTEAFLPSGFQQMDIPASALGESGVYFWRLEAGKLVKDGRLVRR